MLDSFNKKLQALMPVLTPLSVVVGVLLEDIGGKLLYLVPWLFAFMTFASSLSMKFRDVKVFSQYPGTILLCIAFLHLIMPAWAYFLTTLIYDDQLLIIGFVISVAIPTGVTSVIWITITRGNLPLGLSIVLIDTLLSPIVLPFILKAASGEAIAMNNPEKISFANLYSAARCSDSNGPNRFYSSQGLGTGE